MLSDCEYKVRSDLEGSCIGEDQESSLLRRKILRRFCVWEIGSVVARESAEDQGEDGGSWQAVAGTFHLDRN